MAERNEINWYQLAEDWHKEQGKNWLWCWGRKRWYHWTGSYWAWDEKETISLQLDRWLIKRGMNFTHPAIESFSKLVGLRVPVQASEFDQYPKVLSCLDGCIDLETGLCGPPDRGLLATSAVPYAYDPEAGCPDFLAFLDLVQPDRDVQEFLQRFAGVSLTGIAIEKLLYLYGPTAGNGKTTVTETIIGLLGPLAVSIDVSVLMGRSEEHDRARLRGIRMVSVNEATGNVSAARLKEMASTDTMSGRLKYGRATEDFRPSHTAWVRGNHSLEDVDSGDEGAWRRIVQVPFDVVVPEAMRIDHYWDVLLETEGSGILSWAVYGAMDYLANGLQVPPVLSASTRAMRIKNDPILQWVDACTVKNMDAGTPRDKKGHFILRRSFADLFNSYERYCQENGLGTSTSKVLFSKGLERLGTQDFREKNIAFRGGIDLLPGVRFDELEDLGL